MRKLFVFSLAALVAVPALAGGTKTTTTRTYEETSVSPVMGTEMGSDAEMIEAEEAESYDQPLTPTEVDETRMKEQQEMEERNNNSSTIIESEEAIDYSDRTRTNRERKALNTGGDASDDQ
jgi:hypothetical protein